jgi:hypothetical protein
MRKRLSKIALSTAANVRSVAANLCRRPFHRERKAQRRKPARIRTGEKTYLWDTTANVGVIWGYPNHREIEMSNRLLRGKHGETRWRYAVFRLPDPGLASYGHAVFLLYHRCRIAVSVALWRQSSAPSLYRLDAAQRQFLRFDARTHQPRRQRLQPRLPALLVQRRIYVSTARLEPALRRSRETVSSLPVTRLSSF